MTELYFAAALRVGADSGCTRLLPLSLLREPLAPHARFSQRILLTLQAMGFIEPELSLPHAQDWLFSRDWIDHDFTSLSWRILKRPDSNAPMLDLAHLDDLDDARAKFATLVEVWEDLAVAEVAEYARWSLSRAAFNPDWAEEAFSAMKHGLAHFGATQVMYLVYLALRSVAMAHQRGSVHIAQLGHVFASSIANYAQRALKENWTIRGVTRSQELPRSSITVLFADVLTGLGERYFTDRPCLEAIVRAVTNRETLH